MKKNILFLIVLFAALMMSACDNKSEEKKNEESKSDGVIKISVSIRPELEFVKKVGGDKVEVNAVIPPGASPANYAPTSKEMQMLEDSKLYFSIGVNAENNILQSLEGKNIKIINLSEAVSKEHPDRFFDADDHHEHEADEEHEKENHHEHESDEEHEHDKNKEHDSDENHEEEHKHEADENHDEEEHDHKHEGKDPHIWLSPKRIITMTNEISKSLSEIDPDNAEFYKKNAELYIKEIEEADIVIKENIKKSGIKSFLIFHPALGYFGDDYGLEMIAIEKHGKEATPAALKEIISDARKKSINAVFFQKEFSAEQAKTISQELNVNMIELNVLSENVIENLIEMSKLISGGN